VQRFISFLVVWLLMFNGKILGQKNFRFEEKKWMSYNEIISRKIHPVSKLPITYEVLKKMDKPVPGLVAIDCTSGKIIFTPLTFQLPAYINSLGFFCKKELQLDKITKVPVRFRLGSLNYVNWMEQKPNAIKLQ